MFAVRRLGVLGLWVEGCCWASSAAALCAGRGAGGGRLRTGASSGEAADVVREVEMIPLPSMSVRFNAAISCLRARFSDCVDPNSERMASNSLSRSAMSPSSVEIYSIS